MTCSKSGPGPSSSHTIAPIKAAFDFRERLTTLPTDRQNRVDAIHVHLYGSLGATGKGPGPVALLNLLRDPAQTYPIPVGENTVALGPAHIHFERVRYDSPYHNTMVLRLTQPGETLYSEECYLIGGGFIIRKGEPVVDPATVTVPSPYGTMAGLKAQLAHHNLTLDALLMANEMALIGRTRSEINHRIDQLLDFMHKSVRRGLRHSGTLPGLIKLSRKAPSYSGRQKVSVSRGPSSRGPSSRGCPCVPIVFCCF